MNCWSCSVFVRESNTARTQNWINQYAVFITKSVIGPSLSGTSFVCILTLLAYMCLYVCSGRENWPFTLNPFVSVVQLLLYCLWGFRCSELDLLASLFWRFLSALKAWIECHSAFDHFKHVSYRQNTVMSLWLHMTGCHVTQEISSTNKRQCPLSSVQVQDPLRHRKTRLWRKGFVKEMSFKSEWKADGAIDGESTFCL